VPTPGPQAARAHLHLASAPAGRRPVESRLALTASALLIAISVTWLTVVAWIAATLALLPLAWHRAPLGRRLRPRPPREARVIPFQPRRQALPR
jgi:hypothetical protein